jgi:hypothetical protein
MDAHQPVTLKEGDRYPLRPPIYNIAGRVRSPLRSHKPGASLVQIQHPLPFLFHSSTAVVQLTVNQLVVGSIPACGATNKISLWCNGSTAVSKTVSGGSSPSGDASLSIKIQ